MKFFSIAVASLMLALILAACGGSSPGSASSGDGKEALVGAGSTLVAPLMSKWQSEFEKNTEISVTYDAIGSGGGIKQITDQMVDFGASDAPLTEKQFEENDVRGEVIQLPWALSATVLAYNIKGAPNHLKMSGSVLADIYLGKITDWNDPAITKLNPGARLPSMKITPVYRSDGSGDTYAFASYLSTIDPEFRARVGVSTMVKFPAGIGAKKNDGAATAISHTAGAIGYLGLPYASKGKLDTVNIENSAGKFPQPGVMSIEAAANAVSTLSPTNEISLVELPTSAKGAYPISAYSYVIAPRETPKARGLREFIGYVIDEGQQFGPGLSFVPLPKPVVVADKKALTGIRRHYEF